MEYVTSTKRCTIDVSKGLGAVVSGTPAYAIVSFYDSAGGKEALLNFTIKFNGTHNATKNATVTEDTSNDVPSNNNESHDSNVNDANDKRYTQQDLNRARADGYMQGYDDSLSYYDDYGYDYSSSSNSEITSDSGSSSSGSSSSHSGALT